MADWVIQLGGLLFQRKRKDSCLSLLSMVHERCLNGHPFRGSTPSNKKCLPSLTVKKAEPPLFFI